MLKFESVVAKEINSLRTLTAYLLPNSNAIDDVVQLTVMRAHEQWDQFDQKLEPGPWLRSILRFMVKSEVKNKIRESHNKNKFKNEWLKLISEPAMDCEEDRADDDILSFLKDCRSQLAPKSTELIELKYDKKLSCRTISEQCEKSLSWVTTTLSRTRLQLKNCIDNKRGED